MNARFTRREDGVVEIHLPPDQRPLENTLQDAVTTRAPAGSDGINPSTYWIDRTLAAIRQSSTGDVVASGNMSDLIRDGDDLVAHAQYDTFDDHPVPMVQVVDLLDRWRALVVELPGGRSGLG